MDDLKKLSGVEKIEFMFKEGIDFSNSNNAGGKSKVAKQIKFAHLLHLPTFLYKRLYRVLPGFFQDIFFCFSIINKAPSTQMFARTKYDEFRTLVDIKISALTIKSAPKNMLENIKNSFQSGFYTARLDNISEVNTIIDDVMNYAKPSHAGARPYFKDGKNEKLEGSYSAYYTISKKDSARITSILNKNLDKEFNYHLSALAGYRCEFKDIEYSLGIVYGANSNDEMHQDTYASVAKCFIYLQDINENDAPFEFLKGSHIDAAFRSRQTNKAVLSNDTDSAGSTRLRGKELEESIRKYGLKTFTGSKGLFIVANTAGYHRKGAHTSDKPRITLACGVKRKSTFGKLIINLLALIKFKRA